MILSLPKRQTEAIDWQEHVPFAFWLMEMMVPCTVVELGVFRGDSLCAFSQAAAELGHSCEIFGVDNWTGDEHVGQYGSKVYEDLKLYVDTTYPRLTRLIKSDFSDAVDLFEDASIDLLHIDGCHYYDNVKNDFETWLPKVSERGVVLFHDTHKIDDKFGVWKLWKEVTSEYDGFAFPHGNGLGVLLVGKEIDRDIFTPFEEKETSVFAIDLFSRLGAYVSTQIRMTYMKNLVADLCKQSAENESSWRVESEKIEQIFQTMGRLETAVGELGAKANQEYSLHFEKVQKDIGELGAKLDGLQVSLGDSSNSFLEGMGKANTALTEEIHSQNRSFADTVRDDLGRLINIVQERTYTQEALMNLTAPNIDKEALVRDVQAAVTDANILFAKELSDQHKSFAQYVSDNVFAQVSAMAARQEAFVTELPFFLAEKLSATASTVSADDVDEES
jgi:hypothetical protein